MKEKHPYMRGKFLPSGEKIPPDWGEFSSYKDNGSYYYDLFSLPCPPENYGFLGMRLVAKEMSATTTTGSKEGASGIIATENYSHDRKGSL